MSRCDFNARLEWRPRLIPGRKWSCSDGIAVYALVHPKRITLDLIYEFISNFQIVAVIITTETFYFSNKMDSWPPPLSPHFREHASSFLHPKGSCRCELKVKKHLARVFISILDLYGCAILLIIICNYLH